MAKIPLNYFRRQSYKSDTLVSAGATSGNVGLSGIYETPFERASVIISALVSNPDPDKVRTVSAALSTRGTAVTDPSPTYINFLNDFPIAPNDTVNIVVNKLVLGQHDNLYVWETTPDGTKNVTLTLSILETVNTK